MSINAIEKLLWQVSVNPAEAQALREDAASCLSRYRLDEKERSLVSGWQLRAMLDSGVHPMVLLMAYAAVNGPEAGMKYAEEIHKPQA
ncbi:hypothetical protein [Emcibacter nanhaiensis]|uniref:Extradiol ring-cleavage dioxygenase LigAB LigA subunit domain-containing protein n=1 Tax=Emcibacter nanhaiensis TaxID=1505037 RepID=A0A501PVJ1_9PROT|nr:hypothetical protein [Emcibacter nanhaiensis]TPD63786.1 hypothetical protein FIV46_00185 [Emcibacter nanhaiensis]